MLPIEESLNGHNYGSGHSLGQLIGPDCVELERKVGEDHKPTEGGGERENFEDR